jgi:hypothetical protein
MTAPTREQTLKRYKRFMVGAQQEHDRVLKEAAEYSQAYGGNSIGGSDAFALEKVWGDHPPEIAITMSNVDTFWGSLIGSRREPSFGGFDQGLAQEVVAELLTMLVKAGRRWAHSDGVDEAALMDLIVVGYTFVELSLETERPPFRPVERYLGLDRVWWDEGCREQNMADGQEFVVREAFGIDEASARFPDFAPKFEALRAGGDHGSATGRAAAIDGAKNLGGPSVRVSIKGATEGDAQVGGGQGKRLREIAVDAFQFCHYEALVRWTLPDGTPQESTAEVFDQAMKQLAREAAKAGQSFETPSTLPYGQATWYRCKIWSKGSSSNEPAVLSDPEPIPGNQRLIRVMTGKGEWKKDGDELKRRWFGWGRALLGLQRLTSVAIRLEIESEARRNRGGADVERDTFPSQAELQAWVDSRALPGGIGTVPPGALDKIRERDQSQASRVDSMRSLFEFFAIELPKYVLGISDMNRGTFDGDRSVKMIDTMLQASTQMQMGFTSSFTKYLEEGATTMARLILQSFDPEDIDRILGASGAPPRDGITGQQDPQTGDVVPIMIPDPGQPPQVDPATGQESPATKPLTIGRWLKENAGEILDHEIAFGLRPTAATERAANAMLMSQHGVLEQILSAVPEEAKRYVIRAFLLSSFAEGTPLADLVTDLEKVYNHLEQQQNQQAEVQQDDGWLQHISELASSDLQHAQQLMDQAAQAVNGPAGKQQQPGAQGGAASGGPKPPTQVINFKDVVAADPGAARQMLAEVGIEGLGQPAPPVPMPGQQLPPAPPAGA